LLAFAAGIIVNTAAQESQAMTDPDPQEAVAMETAIDLLYRAYAETDPEARKILLEQAVTDDVGHWTRGGMTTGREALSEAIDEFLERHKGRPQTLGGEIQTFRNVARAPWSAIARGWFNSYKGEAYFELADDGRLQEVVNFSDPPHDRLVTGGPQAYVDAWNSDTLEERLAALNAHWASDARWVELRFDHHDVDAIANHMKPVINLEPLDGVMDVMEYDDGSLQVRLQVVVSKRDGELIGTFTDFVAIDARGKVTRLAGFKGKSLTLTHKDGKVDPDWNWSYISGYKDPNGIFAGGSEIMHLTTHNGMLYAANGYWEDNHWLVQKGRYKQSAQVLRLDSANGTWTVDLDLGETTPSGIHIMKGNILKEITFTIMAAGNIYSHISVWVLDDETGEWAQEIVASGEPVKNMRYVPRDVEIFTDKVTGQERVFLLLGNYGIGSGVYDPDKPLKIRWDKEKEYPPCGGMIDVRALGITEANGKLYFSEGAVIFQRNDGEKPTYSELIDFSELIDEESGPLNVEMGGIRGLSGITNPSGQGESLIFMWAPTRKSPGVIKRIDFDDRGNFEVVDEVVIGDLVEELLGDHISVIKILGAYNNFYEIRDPVSGGIVHVIGMQAIFSGDDSLLGQGRYYKGGLYALRTADQKYHLGEINGRYEPGKAHPLGPRSFVHSPFGDNTIYAAGYDSNFVESTGKAWIFNTDLDVFLKPLRD
jgi:hypothetical protein